MPDADSHNGEPRHSKIDPPLRPAPPADYSIASLKYLT